MGNFALSCSAQFECESAHTCKTGPSQVHHSADSGIGMSIVSSLLCISTSSRVLRLTKSWSKYFFGANFNVSPQGVSQLWSLTWNHWKRSKMNQKGWKWPQKKYFDQLLSAHSTQKLIKYTTPYCTFISTQNFRSWCTGEHFGRGEACKVERGQVRPLWAVLHVGRKCCHLSKTGCDVTNSGRTQRYRCLRRTRFGKQFCGRVQSYLFSGLKLLLWL